MNTYDKKIFLDKLKREINSRDFLNALEKAKSIDRKHNSKIVKIEELNNIVDEYVNIQSEEQLGAQNIEFLLYGNPDIVFKLGIEAILRKWNEKIIIEDMCVAQNNMLIEMLKCVADKCNIKLKIDLLNLVSCNDIIKEATNYQKIVCIGNSNTYFQLCDKISNVEFNPYGEFDICLFGNRFLKLKEEIFKYAELNNFEIDFYDDLEFDEAVKAIKKDSFHFCSVVLAEDKKMIDKFKENVKSKYVFANENPFNKIKFEL